MMPKIRVLIVDDAVVVRRIVTDVLSGDPDLEIAGTAPTGRIALAKIPQVNPDIIILDVEMPEMDGLATLSAIRKSYPALPVVMFSTVTQRGAAATLDALALGASDYVAKPANVGSVTIAMQRIREELIPKIKALCARSTGISLPTVDRRPSQAPPRPRTGPAPLSRAKVEVVVIGVSTGGPNALASLLPLFPADFPVPVLIVQHMPPIFTRLLAERLDAKAAIRVVEAAAGDILRPGGAWIAPGDFHMAVAREGKAVRIRTHQEPPENSCRPAVDVLFRSVAAVYGGASLAVVLTGMGRDGLRGCEYLGEVGGQIIVQDESSSVVWGMPGAVANAGMADRIVPLDQLGSEIIGRTCGSHSMPFRARPHGSTGADSLEYVVKK